MMREKKLVANTGTSLLLQICTIICGFILPRMILGAFGSSVNGMVNSISQFLGVIGFLELGVGSVIQSSLYKPLAEKDDESVSKIVVSGQKFFSRLASILLVYVCILMFTYPFFAKQEMGVLYTSSLIAILSISSFAQYYFGIVNSILLTADQRGYVSYITQIITLILNTVFCAVLINCGASFHLVKLTTSLIYVIRPLCLSYYVKKHYCINRKIQYTGEPIKQKWNGVAQHISAVILDGTDSIVLTIFVGLKAVSIYSVYNIIVAGIKQLFLSMTNGVQSLIGELLAKEEYEELNTFFGWVEWSIHTGVVFVFGVTALLIVPFVQIYTQGITDANYIQPLFAVLIVLANAAHCLRLPYNIVILAGGHYKQTQKCYIIAAFLNVIISVVAVKKFGLVGVAIGTLMAMCYQTIWMAIYDSKNIIQWSFKNFVKQIVVDIITIVLMSSTMFVAPVKYYFTLSSISDISWIVLAIKISIVSIIFICVVNLICYKKYMIKLYNALTSVLKKLLDVN